MDSTPNDAPSATHPTPRAPRAKKTLKTVSGGEGRRGRSRTSRARPAAETDASTTESPFMSIDAEMLADLQDASTRKLRAIVKEKPLVALGAALATGFVIGGGWRTRLGRFVLLAGVRYAAVQAAERYFTS